jgi:hypothetical protein
VSNNGPWTLTFLAEDIKTETASEVRAREEMRRALTAAVSKEGRFLIRGDGQVVVKPRWNSRYWTGWRYYFLMIKKDRALWCIEDRDQHGNLYEEFQTELADPNCIDKLCRFITDMPQQEFPWHVRFKLWTRRKCSWYYNWSLFS